MDTETKSQSCSAYIVSHTHWDREWRYPIWETRISLIRFMDELIDVLEKGIYKSFVMDGQVSPMEDYLEFRPEQAQKIKDLVKDGKLIIGPWYTLPDEYPVDGECMIRNLLVGIRKSEALGGPFMVGYTSFGWGQTAQLPQIYNGFGITFAMVGKRVSSKRAPKCEFIWRGPDDSELFSTRFGHLGRQNFFLGLHLSMLFGIEHLGPQWQFNKLDGSTFFHRSERQYMEQDCFRLDPPDTWHPEFLNPEVLEKVWKTMDESLLPYDRLMMNGCDYSGAQKLLPEMIAKINEVDHASGRIWKQSTMTEYISLIQEKVDRSKLVVVEGELRDGPAGHTSGNALATHMDLKRLNKQAQNLLIRVAEPLTVLLQTDCKKFIKKAWLELLLCHPHDSINGVTQDTTAHDVKNKLRQVLNMASAVANEGLKQLVEKIDCSGYDKADDILVVYNPMPYPRREIVEAFVTTDAPAQKFESWPGEETGLVVFDSAGKEMATQWHGSSRELYPVSMLHSRSQPYDCLRHRVFFDTGTIPAGGYKTFAVRSIERNLSGIEIGTSHRQTSSIMIDYCTLENEFLKVTINSNGTFDLESKKTGKIFRNMNYYQDRGDAGDFWINRPPAWDKVISSIGCTAKIWGEEVGPLQATIISEITMDIPSRLIRAEQKRSDDTKPMTIRTAVTLKAHSEQVNVNVTFTNASKDHRLRVMFPTCLSATHVETGGHFIVDSRPVRPQGPDNDSYWPDMATLPTNNFVDISDGSVGLAIIHDSITEYEVSQGTERTLALTLLKSVRTWICTEGRVGSVYPSQNAGQCLGEHSYSYAIRPHTGNWFDAGIPNVADMFNVPVAIAQTSAHKGGLPGGEQSLFSVNNEMIRFSALKKTENGDNMVLRVCNLAHSPQNAMVNFSGKLVNVWQTDLNEKRLHSIRCDNEHGFKIFLGPHKIATYEIEQV